MSEPKQGPTGVNIGIDQEAFAKRKAELQDAYNFSAYIPDELRAQLETGLSPEMRTAVLQLQILAIKYGRAAERRDQQGPRIVVMPQQPQPSNLVKKLVDRAGRQIENEKRDLAYEQIHTIDKDKKVDIFVAPGFLDLTKKTGYEH